MISLVDELKTCGLIGLQNYTELSEDLTAIVLRERELGGVEFGVSDIQRLHGLGYNRASRALDAGLRIGLFSNGKTGITYRYVFSSKGDENE